MVKIQTNEQRLYFEKAKKTMGERILLTEDDWAILQYPSIFPTNKSRFYNSVTQKANLALSDVDYLFYTLPDTYKEKIFTGFGMEDFLNLLIGAENVTKKKSKTRKTKEKKSKSSKKSEKEAYQYTFEPKTFSTAVTMFNVSLSHILGSLPSDLHESLKNEIFQFLSTINGIAELSMKKEKQNYVLPKITHDLLPQWHPQKVTYVP